MHAPAPKRFRDALPFQLRPSNLKTQKGSRPWAAPFAFRLNPVC